MKLAKITDKFTHKFTYNQHQEGIQTTDQERIQLLHNSSNFITQINIHKERTLQILQTKPKNNTININKE